MSVQLREIDVKNWEQCIRLSVFENQKGFVADNCYSLLQSKFTEELYPLSIYNQETIVGFLMYGVDPDTKRKEMCRLMVDKNHQGRGYGKEAINQLLELIKNTYGSIEFYTSVEPENVNTIKLYENVGFIKTGEIMWDEVVLKIQL
ncbi:GNAT family N-acetyltransferase [Radiobacillus kanasensis]|uniref:GNAT family N-acetyltransferase n=1 Tax=Radiobacillus kanasensis TaxID=2844358 RepID=UPI001E2A63E9|nr:GNAT family N-acetyltransferase [Radiobacillus kanasensis]UFT99938.1 GNAT family N-acetyltransferase [Radiobacillus kanasensis]